MARTRRSTVVLAAGAVLLLASCRSDTVTVAFRPEVADSYEYRYEIQATVTRALEGQEPEVLEVDTELTARQEVRSISEDGVRARVVLRREGGVSRDAVILLDRAGSLEGFELLDGLDAAVFGVSPDTSLVPTSLGGPPDRPLSPGERWTLRDGPRRSTGRLERLGVVDGEDVAFLTTRLTHELDEDGSAGGRPALVAGLQRAGASTAYDLADGAIRSSRSWSRAELEAELLPPEGVTAEPALATISYDVTVRVTRLR